MGTCTNCRSRETGMRACAHKQVQFRADEGFLTAPQRGAGKRALASRL